MGIVFLLSFLACIGALIGTVSSLAGLKPVGLLYKIVLGMNLVVMGLIEAGLISWLAWKTGDRPLWGFGLATAIPALACGLLANARWALNWAGRLPAAASVDERRDTWKRLGRRTWLPLLFTSLLLVAAPIGMSAALFGMPTLLARIGARPAPGKHYAYTLDTTEGPRFLLLGMRRLEEGWVEFHTLFRVGGTFEKGHAAFSKASLDGYLGNSLINLPCDFLTPTEVADPLPKEIPIRLRVQLPREFRIARLQVLVRMECTKGQGASSQEEHTLLIKDFPED